MANTLVEELVKIGVTTSHPGGLFKRATLPSLNMNISQISMISGIPSNIIDDFLSERRPADSIIAAGLTKLESSN